ncbi:MAG: hypothetical protein GY756_26500 [bacterium]|nr:hypothetical protein [bacterium]
MNYKYKNITIALGLSLIFTITGCSVIHKNEKIEKINKNEYSSLLFHARRTIYDMPERKISAADKKYIKYKKPEFDVKYDGYKSGRYTLTWDINNKKIVKYIGEGNLTDTKGSFKRISIVTIHINSNKYN